MVITSRRSRLRKLCQRLLSLGFFPLARRARLKRAERGGVRAAPPRPGRRHCTGLLLASLTRRKSARRPACRLAARGCRGAAAGRAERDSHSSFKTLERRRAAPRRKWVVLSRQAGVAFCLAQPGSASPTGSRAAHTRASPISLLNVAMPSDGCELPGLLCLPCRRPPCRPCSLRRPREGHDHLILVTPLIPSSSHSPASCTCVFVCKCVVFWSHLTPRVFRSSALR